LESQNSTSTLLTTSEYEILQIFAIYVVLVVNEHVGASKLRCCILVLGLDGDGALNGIDDFADKTIVLGTKAEGFVAGAKALGSGGFGVTLG